MSVFIARVMTIRQQLAIEAQRFMLLWSYQHSVAPIRLRLALRGVLGGLVILASSMVTPQPAMAFIQHSLLESAGGIVYSAWYNDGGNSDGSLGGVNVLTQLAVSHHGQMGLGDASNGYVTEFIAVPDLVTPFGQTTILAGRPTGFDPSGTGLLMLTGGLTIGLTDFGAFEGVATTLDPSPNVLYPCCFDPGPYPIFGFNMGPGGHPTSQIPYDGGLPVDGIVLGPLQTVVFGIVHDPYWSGLGIGGAGFYFNADLHLTGGGVDLDGLSGWARPPVIPEPNSLTLLGTGLFGAMSVRSVRKRGHRSTGQPV